MSEFSNLTFGQLASELRLAAEKYQHVRHAALAVELLRRSIVERQNAVEAITMAKYIVPDPQVTPSALLAQRAYYLGLAHLHNGDYAVAVNLAEQAAANAPVPSDAGSRGFIRAVRRLQLLSTCLNLTIPELAQIDVPRGVAASLEPYVAVVAAVHALDAANLHRLLQEYTNVWENDALNDVVTLLPGALEQLAKRKVASIEDHATARFGAVVAEALTITEICASEAKAAKALRRMGSTTGSE